MLILGKHGNGLHGLLRHADLEQAAGEPPGQPGLYCGQRLAGKPVRLHRRKLPHERKDRQIRRARRWAANRYKNILFLKH